MLFIGANAYKVVSLDSAQPEIIVKKSDKGDTSDPLNQRKTVGWKINGYGAAITIQDYILRVECCSSLEDDAN